MPAAAVEELLHGYEFLRYTEHALQAIGDRQTQMLPQTELDQARIASLLGFSTWSDFHQQLMHWRGRIDWHFRQVIADPDEDEAKPCAAVGVEWLPLWEEAVEPESAMRQLEDAGFVDPQAAFKRIIDLKRGPQVRAMQRMGRERLDAFMPRLLAQ